MYSIGELAELAGVSARTLRYYDREGLLKPSVVNEAGYRLYGEREVDLLQQILFYRKRGMKLSRIRQIIYEKDFDIAGALEEHLSVLEEERAYRRFDPYGAAFNHVNERRMQDERSGEIRGV